VRISYDPDKREWTLRERGLDFEDAAAVFADPRSTTLLDDRRDYGEERYQTFGYMGGRLVMVVWTLRGGDEQRIISMRKANEREQARFRQQSGEG
jgi:uncharacterized DUF497 family protein